MTRWFSRGEDDLHQSVKATLISITSSFWNKRRMYDNEKNIQPNEGNNGLRKRMMMKYNDRLDEEWCSWFCNDNHITRSSRRLFSLSFFFFFSLWPPMISHKKKDLNILDGNHHAWSSFDDSLSSLSQMRRNETSNDFSILLITSTHPDDDALFDQRGMIVMSFIILTTPWLVLVIPLFVVTTCCCFTEEITDWSSNDQLCLSIVKHHQAVLYFM